MLTPRQSELLAFIGAHQAEHGCSPSFAEMMTGIGLHSKSSVHRLLGGLEERKIIIRRHDRARAIEIVRMPDHTEREARLAAVLREISELSVLATVRDPGMAQRMAERALT